MPGIVGNIVDAAKLSSPLEDAVLLELSELPTPVEDP
jgi:hypothetical protein